MHIETILKTNLFSSLTHFCHWQDVMHHNNLLYMSFDPTHTTSENELYHEHYCLALCLHCNLNPGLYQYTVFNTNTYKKRNKHTAILQPSIDMPFIVRVKTHDQSLVLYQDFKKKKGHEVNCGTSMNMRSVLQERIKQVNK